MTKPQDAGPPHPEPLSPVTRSRSRALTEQDEENKSLTLQEQDNDILVGRDVDNDEDMEEGNKSGVSQDKKSNNGGDESDSSSSSNNSSSTSSTSSSDFDEGPVCIGSPPIPGSKSMLLSASMKPCGKQDNCNSKAKRKICGLSESSDADSSVEFAGVLSRGTPNKFWATKLDHVRAVAFSVAEEIQKQRIGHREKAKTKADVPKPQAQQKHKYQLEDLFVCTNHHEFTKIQLALLRDNFIVYDAFYVSATTKRKTQNRQAMCTHCLFDYKTIVDSNEYAGGGVVRKTPALVMNKRKALTVHLKHC
jgi:hypothetical protein